LNSSSRIVNLLLRKCPLFSYHITPDRAVLWLNAGFFNAEDIIGWRQAVFAAEEAENWVNNGVQKTLMITMLGHGIVKGFLLQMQLNNEQKDWFLKI